MNILVEAYGCTLNRGEAAEFLDSVIEAGHLVVESDEDADVLAIFTCGVIDTTERHMLKRIAQLARLQKRLLVCGCLGDISPKKILDIAPWIEIFQPACHQEAIRALSHEDIKAQTKTEVSSIGILPIASGCVGKCTYCVTRSARGQLQSREVEAIVGRAKDLISKGAVELQVCAQDTAIYGEDIESDLGLLLSGLSALEGDYMIRIGMMNPQNVIIRLETIISAFEHKKVFRFLHLPVQSGSDRILSRMGREYSVKEFRDILTVFRTKFPNCTVSTDIITGFPGETEEDFTLTLGLVKDIEPDIVNITRFSSRPGTLAMKMDDQIPSRIAKQRSRELTDLRFSIGRKIFQNYIDREVCALATEYRQSGTTFLRTSNYRPIVVDDAMPLGKWYDVRITGQSKTHLVGRLVDQTNYPNP
jgi:MiaB-like tRNA modifying enzyme